ncbi:hypothetical protein N665_0453s0015, partial [Sinapis alba]
PKSKPTQKFNVLTIAGEHEGDNAISDEHQLLTLETDKMVWRRIECGTPHSPISGGVCISAFSKASMIVCFDIRSEKYKFIRVGKSSTGAVDTTTTLLNYNGKLASLVMERSYCFAESHIGFDMWHTYKFCLSNNAIEVDKYSVGVTCTNEIGFFPNKVSAPFHIFHYSLERKTI